MSAAPPRFDITRFDVQGNTLLMAAEIDALLAPYRGTGREFADVQRAVDALQSAYARHGFALVRVGLPEQELNEGVVRLRVVETRIGRVVVEGNRFHDAANIRRSVPSLAEGESPNLARISASLAQANENPSKKVTLQLQDGGREGQVDARLAVADEKPWTLALNVDNTGAASTGETMVGVVYQNTNIAGLDHVLSLQFTTTAEKPKSVAVYGAGYHVPLYSLGDSLDFYASYSDVDSGSVLAGIFNLQVSGKGTVLGARYNHAFATRRGFESIASLAFDHKDYRNDVTLEGIPIGNDITVDPVSLSYAGTWKEGASAAAFTLSFAANVPGGERGDARDFERVRAGARPGYTLARYGLAYTHALPFDWQARVATAGQYTRDALVPGEQFGAGGMGSVRGFQTREIAADTGVSGSAELYTPDLCGRLRFPALFCRALVFYDAAHVSRNKPLPGEISGASIGSIGAALRASLGRATTLQLDFGHVIDAGPVEPRGHNHVNFRLSLAY